MRIKAWRTGGGASGVRRPRRLRWQAKPIATILTIISTVNAIVNVISSVVEMSGGIGEFGSSGGPCTASTTLFAIITTRLMLSNHCCSMIQMKKRRKRFAGVRQHSALPAYVRPDGPIMLATGRRALSIIALSRTRCIRSGMVSTWVIGPGESAPSRVGWRVGEGVFLIATAAATAAGRR